MRLPLRPASLFALAAALTASAGAGQPTTPAPQPRAEKPYTAFPDLTPPARDAKGGKGDADAAPLPPVPKVAADAPPLRRVQAEQIKEGLAYLRKSEAVIRLGAWDINLLQDYANVAAAVYTVAAELEERPEKRVPWFEARVRRLKEFEAAAERAVRYGGLQSQALNLARLQRLQAEADLLRLKADVERGKGAQKQKEK